MNLKNKTAIITGGARGIGLATSVEFLKRDANVVIIDKNESDLLQAIEKHDKYKNKLLGITANITRKNDIKEIINKVCEKFGKIDILINNAGITEDSKFINMSESQWDQVLEVNLKGPFIFTQEVVKSMIKQNYGVILNASSIVGLYGNFGQSNYAASKFGINGLTKTWARELGKYNIRVNSVAPGFIMTNMISEIPIKVLDNMKSKIFLNKFGEAEDIAHAYAFLASDNAKYITGTVLSVDGGLGF